MRTTVVIVIAAACAMAGSQNGRTVCAVESDELATESTKASTGEVCCLPATGNVESADTKLFTANGTSNDAAAGPLACSLTDSELRSRLEELRVLLKKAARNIVRESSSVSVTFAEGHSAEVMKFVELERACCPFFSFTLRLPAGKPMELTVSAPPGGETFLKELFPDGD